MGQIELEMNSMEQEMDYIILECIIRSGYPAMPMNYTFLKRYSLLNNYYGIVDNITAGSNYKHLEEAAKQQAKIQQAKISLSGVGELKTLRAFMDANGIDKTKELFRGNKTYWRSFCQFIKKM